MATLTITVSYPDEKQIDLRDTLASAFGYESLINGQPNPQNKSSFVQQSINEEATRVIKNIYRDEKQKLASLSIIDLI